MAIGHGYAEIPTQIPVHARVFRPSSAPVDVGERRPRVCPQRPATPEGVGAPDVTAIAHAPLIYQIHATVAWHILGIWPFTRLVHAWSIPAWYLWRPRLVYRNRQATHLVEPGTELDQPRHTDHRCEFAAGYPIHPGENTMLYSAGS